MTIFLYQCPSSPWFYKLQIKISLYVSSSCTPPKHCLKTRLVNAVWWTRSEWYQTPVNYVCLLLSVNNMLLNDEKSYSSRKLKTYRWHVFFTTRFCPVSNTQLLNCLQCNLRCELEGPWRTFCLPFGGKNAKTSKLFPREK